MKKYKLPYNHELFSSQTVLDLLVEFNEDLFENDPNELRAALASDGKSVVTGDALIDDWFQTLEHGGIVNLWEAFSEESKRETKARLLHIEAKKRKPHTFGDTALAVAQKSTEKLGEIPLTFGE